MRQEMDSSKDYNRISTKFMSFNIMIQNISFKVFEDFRKSDPNSTRWSNWEGFEIMIDRLNSMNFLVLDF